MYKQDFCYWLQGYFELVEDGLPLSAKQVQVIKNHLNLVFKHEIDDMYTGDKQELQGIHDHKVSSIPVSPNDPLVRC